MSVETGTANSAHIPQKGPLRVGKAVLLVAAGLAVGLLVGAIAWQDNATSASGLMAAVPQVGSFEDYALRHGPEAITEGVTRRVGSFEDYALRHGLEAITEGVTRRVGSFEDYALRHPSGPAEQNPASMDD